MDRGVPDLTVGGAMVVTDKWERMTIQVVSSTRIGSYVFFFFQAEDGIRDLTVTGVQTCALPIYAAAGRALGPAFRGRGVPPPRQHAASRAAGETRERSLGAVAARARHSGAPAPQRPLSGLARRDSRQAGARRGVPDEAARRGDGPGGRRAAARRGQCRGR